MATQQSFEFDTQVAETRRVSVRQTLALAECQPRLTPPDPIAALQSKIAGLTTAARKTAGVFSSGCESLDAWLPGGGLASAAITEWVDGSPATSGAATLAFLAGKHLPDHQTIVVIDPDQTFYPPAAVALGIDADRIVWCKPSSPADTVWTIDQSLRCPQVGAVVAWVDRRLDDRDARRFQLAAEEGQTAGLLVRPAAVRGKPSFAKTRFHVASPPVNQHHQRICSTPLTTARFFLVTLDRVKGGTTGRQMVIAIDDQSQAHVIPESLLRQIVLHKKASHAPAALHLASRLANPATMANPATTKRTGANRAG